MQEEPESPTLLEDKEAARLAGMKRYLGRPCVRCQGRVRYASNDLCVPCQASRTKKWSEENKERHVAAIRTWQVENADRVKETARRRIAQDPERHRSLQKAQYRKHRGKILLRARQAYRNDPEKFAEECRRWRYEVNPERHQVLKAFSTIRRYEKMYNLPTDLTVDDLHEMWLAQGQRCAYCGSVEQPSIDHKIPISRGGSNRKENVHWTCEPCNREKWTMTDEEYRAARRPTSVNAK